MTTNNKVGSRTLANWAGIPDVGCDLTPYRAMLVDGLMKVPLLAGERIDWTTLHLRVSSSHGILGVSKHYIVIAEVRTISSDKFHGGRV